VNSRFLYAGAQAVGEYDSSGALISRYVPGAGLDDYAAYTVGTGGSITRDWPVADPLGSVVGVTNSSNVATQINTYDEYGVPGTFSGRFGYAGSMYLNRAMAAPWFMRNRQYNPSLGRFMQTDPIGIAGGVNLYGYVGNDPVNFTDPWGLVPQYVRWCRVTGRVLPDGSFEITATCWIEFVDPSGPGFIQTGPNSYNYVGGVSGGGAGVSSSTENQQRCEQLLGASRALGNVGQGFGRASAGASFVGLLSLAVPGAGEVVAPAARGVATGFAITSAELNVAAAVTYGAATGDWAGAGTSAAFDLFTSFGGTPGVSGLGADLAGGVAGGVGGEIVSFANIRSQTCAAR